MRFIKRLLHDPAIFTSKIWNITTIKKKKKLWKKWKPQRFFRESVSGGTKDPQKLDNIQLLILIKFLIIENLYRVI